MGFKLLRVDVNDTCKIQLEVGKHLIGRGKFLHCDDKRVSRRHGELEVTDHIINLKALHTNPCFYVRRGTVTRELLKQNDSVSLGHGDRFGLLPVDCWYEVLFMPNLTCNTMDQNHVKQESPLENRRISEYNGLTMLDNTEVDIGITDRTESLMLAPQSSNENVSDPPPQIDNELSPSSLNESNMSQSLIQDLHLPEPLQNISDPSEVQNPPGSFQPPLETSENPQDSSLNPQDLSQNPQDITQNLSEQQNSAVKIKTEPVDQDLVAQSPLKRPLPSTSDVKQETGEDEAKKIKTETDGAAAGTSNGLDANPAGTPGPAGPAGAPPAATPRPRERCMYGANCYRRNPIHKQEFSHPSDEDWGPGPLGVCPYGAACRRRNPTHWVSNTHPPGTVPPAQRQPQGNKQRRKKKRQSTDSEDSGQDTADTQDSPDVILTGKRARKKVELQKWSDSESNDEDPFQTDDEDEWQPSGSLGTNIDSQSTQDD